MGKNEYEPAPSAPAAHFVYARPRRDTLWAVAFALAWAAAIAAGIYGVRHRNPAFLHIDWQDPAACPALAHDRRGLREALADKHADDFSLGQFAELTGRWLALSAALALLLGLAFVKLFQHHSGPMVKATIYSQIAVGGWERAGWYVGIL